MRISDWSSDVCSSDLLAAHCTRITAAARLASFLVFGQLVEATLLGVLVDFGATNLASADDEKYSRFLAAFQWPDDLVDDAIVDQRLPPLRNFHAVLLPI